MIDTNKNGVIVQSWQAITQARNKGNIMAIFGIINLILATLAVASILVVMFTD